MASHKKHQSHKISKETVFFVFFVVLWAALSLIASQFVVARVLKFFIGAKIAEPFWVLIYYIISYVSAISLILFIPPRLRQIYHQKHTQKSTSKTTKPKSTEHELSATRSELGLDDTPTFTDIGLAPVGYVVYVIFANILTALFSALSWFDANQSQNVGFSYFITTADRFFAMIAIVLIAPIAEEIIMRGWLYGKLRSRTGIIFAIVVTSLVFGLLHGQWNVAVVTFALSVILCSLREITGTIWSGILLHILVNGIAFYVRYVAQII